MTIIETPDEIEKQFEDVNRYERRVQELKLTMAQAFKELVDLKRAGAGSMIIWKKEMDILNIGHTLGVCDYIRMEKQDELNSMLEKERRKY